MKMKNYLLIFGGLALVGVVLILGAVVKAQNATSTFSVPSVAASSIIKGINSAELKQQLNISEIRGRMICKELKTCSGIADKGAIEILMKAAKVTEIGDNYLKVSIFNYAYKIDTVGANFVRHWWGQSNINEFSVGDIINAWGYLDENDTSLVHAKTIRNVSIQWMYGVFNGIIASIDSVNNTFVLKTESRGSQTIIVSSDTKIVKATSTASFGDLQVGMGVIVRGVWNKTLSKIQAQVINIPGSVEGRPFLKDNFIKDLKNKLKIK